ncbi:MAG: hypothetical protein P8P83_04010, partial [Rickettsiaceae bacterium]|nr:hypothetical protein [Rickettsiaceae bacterium]
EREALTPARIEELKEMVYQTNLKMLESAISSKDGIDVLGMIIQQLVPQEYAQAEEGGMMGLEGHDVTAPAAEEEAQLDVAGQASEEED